mgnify:CR=1 FL=1
MKIEDILNMKIKAGVHQWDGSDNDGMTSGSVQIWLPNDTIINITSVVFDSGRNSCEVTIHNMNDTKLNIFSKVKKSIKRVTGTVWTKISGVEV